jgi:NADH-quinone oxidoreductase subunit C
VRSETPQGFCDVTDETTTPQDAAQNEELVIGQESTSAAIDNEAVAAALGNIDGLIDVNERRYASSEATYHMALVESGSWLEAIEGSRNAGFDFFIDLYAVDHFSQAPRFEVGINLLSMQANERLIISTRVPYDVPSLPSVTGLFVGANFYEREAYDLFGIEFTDHPDLTRILLPDDWEGYPLRKDYSVGSIPVQFKAGSVDL